MSIWTQIATIVAALFTGGGLWAWLTANTKRRGDLDQLDYKREVAAIEVLTARIAVLENELKTIRHDAAISRRVGHDMGEIAAGARMLLIMKLIEINAILEEHGKPERYPNPVKSSIAAMEEISQQIVGERQSLRDKAERLERESEIQQTVTEVKKEQIVKEAEKAKE